MRRIYDDYVPTRATYTNDEEREEARKAAQKRYMRTEKGKTANRAAQARYRAKTAPATPSPKAPGESLPSWLLKPPMTPEARKAAQKAYMQSEKGKAANRAAQARYRAKKAIPDWLK